MQLRKAAGIWCTMQHLMITAAFLRQSLLGEAKICGVLFDPKEEVDEAI